MKQGKSKESKQEKDPKKNQNEKAKKKFRDNKHDFVDEASIESFPASDAPSLR